MINKIKYTLVLIAFCFAGCAKNEFEHRLQNPAAFTKTVSIEDIKTLYKEQPLTLSTSFFIEGIVVGVEGNSLHLQEKAESGIRIYHSSQTSFAPGDKLKVALGGKTLTKEGNILVLKDVTEIEKIGEGVAIVTPVTVTRLRDNLAKFASTLVSVENVEIGNSTDMNGGKAFDIKDATGTVKSFLRTNADYQLPDKAAVFTGVVSVNENIVYLNTRKEEDIQKVYVPPTVFELIVNNSDLVKTPISDAVVDIAPGVKLIQAQYINSANLATAFAMFEVDLTQTDVALEVGMPDDKPVFGKRQSLADMAKFKNATLAASGRTVLGGIAGDFWSTTPVEPFGPVVRDGVELKSGFYDNREFFGVLKDRTCIVGNKAVYDQNKQNLQQAIGGRAILLNGEIVDQATARDPRPAIAYSTDKKVYLFIGDGRQTAWSNGFSTFEMAKLFKAIGAHSAVYMAGGNSAMAVLKNSAGTAFDVITKPSGPLDAWIINSWLISTKAE